jgi:hypothetical protein
MYLSNKKYKFTHHNLYKRVIKNILIMKGVEKPLFLYGALYDAWW